MKFFLLIMSATFALTPNSSVAESAEHTEGPCMKIMAACKTAGYNKSLLNEKKSLSKDCIQPILNAKKVEGVDVDPKDIEACNLKKTELKTDVKAELKFKK